MVDMALEDIKQNGMLPEESKNRDIPHFTPCFNVLCLPAETKSSNNKGYNPFIEHGKKAVHFEVTKEEVNYVKY